MGSFAQQATLQQQKIAAQNAAYGSILSDYISGTSGSRADLEKQIKTAQEQLKTVPLYGPTPAELEAHPALKNAWDELNVIWKLANGGAQ